MRKPRSDSKLLNQDILPEERQAQLAEWLLSGMPYHRAQELVEKEWGVHASMSAFSHFWEQVCAPLLIARRRKAVRVADEVATEAQREPGQFDQATIDALKQRAFELAISPQADPRDVKSLFMLVQKSMTHELDRQKLELEREKFAALERRAAQAAEVEGTVKDKSLTPEEQAERIRQIFGIAA